MKKNKEEKKESLFSKFKDIWSVPRYKALIKLGLYAVFFLTLFLISQISSSFNTTENVPKNANKDIIFESYTYTYKITKDNVITTYTGTSTSESNNGLIKYSNNNSVQTYIFDKKENKIYINGKEVLKLYDIDDKYFSYEYLDSIIKKSNDGKYVDDENNIIQIKKQESNNTKKYDVVITSNENVILYLELHKIN